MSTHNITPAAVREIYNTDDIGTHSFECWKWHPRCAVLALADLLEKLQPDDEPPDRDRLYSTTDAYAWAEEFAKVCPDVDQGLMIGWFANAIETGKAVRLPPDTADVAADLEAIFDHSDPKMNGSFVVELPLYGDRPGSVGATLPPPTVALLHRAAEILRGEK